MCTVGDDVPCRSGYLTRDERLKFGRANGMSFTPIQIMVLCVGETLSIVLDAFNIAHDRPEDPSTSVAC